MNIRKQRKKKLKFIQRDYSDWCCKECYFGWGPGAKHTCSQSNNDGILKKYWKEYDLWYEDYIETEGEDNFC